MSRPQSSIRDRRADELLDSLKNYDPDGAYAEAIEWQGGFQRFVDTNTVWDALSALKAVYKGRYLSPEYFEIKKALVEARSAVRHLAEQMSFAQYDNYERAAGNRD